MLLLLLLSIGATAQEQVVNAAGGNYVLGSLLFDYSIGEPLTMTHESAGTIITEGFLQPFTTDHVVAERAMANNFITPNGDGRNEVLFFADLEKYPKNGLRIFDRAGRLLYHASPYHNDWDGRYRGKLLEEDTYYYILDRGKLSGLKGFVTIIHDVKGGRK